MKDYMRTASHFTALWKSLQHSRWWKA